MATEKETQSTSPLRRSEYQLTLKMDVSYTDHSHIIGKGGLTIKKVLDKTQCHIHFPDSNRTDVLEKSNQVSIAGETMEAVEEARASIRSLMPLIFWFELPMTPSMSIDPSDPIFMKIQNHYSVQLKFHHREYPLFSLISVKGRECEAERVIEATNFLIAVTCGSAMRNQTLVQMTMEISPQHHNVVLGVNRNNLKSIMENTSTKISFPNARNENISSLSKHHVVISGYIFNVYAARRRLLESLPIAVLFDLSKDLIPDTRVLLYLMKSLDVCIKINEKQKHSDIMLATVKGAERNASNVYLARRFLLEESIFEVNIPLGYDLLKPTPYKNYAEKKAMETRENSHHLSLMTHDYCENALGITNTSGSCSPSFVISPTMESKPSASNSYGLSETMLSDLRRSIINHPEDIRTKRDYRDPTPNSRPQDLLRTSKLSRYLVYSGSAAPGAELAKFNNSWSDI